MHVVFYGSFSSPFWSRSVSYQMDLLKVLVAKIKAILIFQLINKCHKSKYTEKHVLRHKFVLIPFKKGEWIKHEIKRAQMSVSWAVSPPIWCFTQNLHTHLHLTSIFSKCYAFVKIWLKMSSILHKISDLLSNFHSNPSTIF